MAVADRLVKRVLDSEVELTRDAASRELHRLLATESPLSSNVVVDSVVDSLVRLGPLEPLLRDPTVSDVLVNGHSEVWVERSGVMERTEIVFIDDAAVVAAVERTIAPLGLRLDRASPLVSARLADGSRLHAAIPPVSVSGPIVAIRRFTAAVRDLDAFVRAGSMSHGQRIVLTTAIRERRNIVVSGATGTGKTTLLNALVREIGDSERIVTIEDAAELAFGGHVVRLEARPPNVEGEGEVTLSDLVRTALRLRPDRIVLGEVRGPEALEMIAAMNTGHDGSLSTVHANGPDDALWRLETLALSAGSAGEQAIRRQLWSAIDLIVHLARKDGERKVVSISRVDPTGCREIEC